MASFAIAQIDIPQLQATVESAGEMLLQFPIGSDTSSTKQFGEVVNTADLAVQTFLHTKLGQRYPDAIFVGEEDIPGSCLQEFPKPLDRDQLYIVLDPCDGSANYSNNSNDYAVTVGFQVGNQPVLGISYLPVWKKLILGGPDLPTTIDNKPIGGLRDYTSDDIRVGYGLGKRRPKDVCDAFHGAIMDLTDEHFRPSCLSVSLLRWLKGEFDLYASLKEEWYKTCPWYAILSGIPLDGAGEKTWTISIDPDQLNLNDAFCFSVATRAAAERHLQPGTALGEFLSNLCGS